MVLNPGLHRIWKSNATFKHSSLFNIKDSKSGVNFLNLQVSIGPIRPFANFFTPFCGKIVEQRSLKFVLIFLRHNLTFQVKNIDAELTTKQSKSIIFAKLKILRVNKLWHQDCPSPPSSQLDCSSLCSSLDPVFLQVKFIVKYCSSQAQKHSQSGNAINAMQ